MTEKNKQKNTDLVQNKNAWEHLQQDMAGFSDEEVLLEFKTAEELLARNTKLKKERTDQDYQNLIDRIQGEGFTQPSRKSYRSVGRLLILVATVGMLTSVFSMGVLAK